MPFKRAFEKGINIEEVSAAEERDFKESPEARGIDFVEDMLDLGANGNNVLMGLAGLDNDRTWAIRRDLITPDLSLIDLSHSLAGLNSSQAWEIRDDLIEKLSKYIENVQ